MPSLLPEAESDTPYTFPLCPSTNVPRYTVYSTLISDVAVRTAILSSQMSALLAVLRNAVLHTSPHHGRYHGESGNVDDTCNLDSIEAGT